MGPYIVCLVTIDDPTKPLKLPGFWSRRSWLPALISYRKYNRFILGKAKFVTKRKDSDDHKDSARPVR